MSEPSAVVSSTTPSAEVVDYLITRGHLPSDDRHVARATRLSGGVSAETVLVETATARLVVKRPLEKLLVPGEWTAATDRAMTEAAALQTLHAVTPQHVPLLIDADPHRNIVVMAAAPADQGNWKTILMGEAEDFSAGAVDVGAMLGRVLGAWHARTRDDRVIAARFRDDAAFESLRIAPFYRQIAAKHDRLAGPVSTCIEQLEEQRECLVHGDYSPKNVLVGPSGLTVLDFEVARVGAPVFDLAFMHTHLILKALHRPGEARLLAATADAFLTAYQHTMSADVDPLLGTHITCLLLARVDGLSPAAYLSPHTAGTVRALALKLLAGPAPTVEHIWSSVRQENP